MGQILAAGAGAAEGLDRMLARMMAEDKLAEAKRQSQVDEGLRSRQLDLNEEFGRQNAEALSMERDARTRQINAGIDQDNRIRQYEDEIINDPAAPDTIKSFIKLRRATPKGEQVPYQLFGVGGTPPSTQVHTVTYKGKPVDASYDPRTQKYTYKGVDITNDVEHYEKPTPPTVIQTGDSYGLLNKGTGKVSPVTGANNQSVPLAAPQQQRSRAASAQAVSSHIDDVISEAEQMDKIGLMGPIGGRWSDFAAGTWGSAQDIAKLIGRKLTPAEEEALGEFRTDVSLLKSGTAMVHGGARGGGSIEMMKYFDRLMNANKMDMNLFRGTAKSFKKWLNKYANLSPDSQGSGDSQDSGDTGSPNDLYQQYLSRGQK